MKPRLHNMQSVPAGRTIRDVLPAFAGVRGEIRVGTPNPECACCRKPFGAVRKPRKSIRLASPLLAMPVVYEYRVCGACLAMHQGGGEKQNAFLAAIEAYHDGIDLAATS